MKTFFDRREFLQFVGSFASAIGFLKSGANGQTARSGVKNGEKPFFVEQDLFVAGTEGYHTYRIPSIIPAKKNNLLAFCEGRKSGSNDSGDIDLLFRRSTDKGKTWSKQQVLWHDAGNTCGNPCPVVERKTGAIHLLMTQNLGVDSEAEIIDGKSAGTRTVWHSKSTDEGETWSTPENITRVVKSDDWTWYATGPGAGIQLASGRLVVPCDHIEKTTKKQFSHVIYSDDGGKTWRLGGRVSGGLTNECEVVELADQRLLLNMRNYNRNYKSRAVSLSSDQGLTWSPVTYDEKLIEPVCQASIRRYSTVKNGGRSRILFSNPASDKREKMTVRLSTDECRTWSAEKIVFAGAAAYSCLAVSPADRTIYCLYERGENSPYERITLAKFNLAWLTGDDEK